MSKVEMKVPSPGESITEVQIARWICKDGAYVEKDDEICEIDSDKATLTLNAEASGTIKILAKEGETVAVGAVVCAIDTDGVAPEIKKEEKPKAKNENQGCTSRVFIRPQQTGDELYAIRGYSPVCVFNQQGPNPVGGVFFSVKGDKPSRHR